MSKCHPYNVVQVLQRKAEMRSTVTTTQKLGKKQPLKSEVVREENKCHYA